MQFPVSRFGWFEQHARLAGSLDDRHFHIREYRELSSHSSTRRFSFLCNHHLLWIAEDVDYDGGTYHISIVWIWLDNLHCREMLSKASGSAAHYGWDGL